MIKSNKEVTLGTRETYFFQRKPQKIKIPKDVIKKNVFKKVTENFLFSRRVA